MMRAYATWMMTPIAALCAACGPAGDGAAADMAPGVDASAYGLQWNAPWPMEGQSATHAGRSPHAGPKTQRRRWTFAGDRYPASPGAAIAADGTIYIATHLDLNALDGATGAKRWGFHVALAGLSAPAIGADGTVFINNDGTYALDGATGQLKWSRVDEAAYNSSPTLGADGTLYVGSSRSLRALDPATGATKWSYSLENGGSPSLDTDGNVYVVDRIGTLYSFVGETGRLRWRLAVGGNLPVAPTISGDGKVFVGTSNGVFFAIDAATGRKLWSIPLDSPVFGAAALGADGTVYANAEGAGILYALDPASGRQNWVFAPGTWIRNGPIVDADGTVYLGCGDSFVYAVDGRNGQQKRTLPMKAPAATSLAIAADGTIIVGDTDGNVNAIGP